MKVISDNKKIQEILTRGVAEVIDLAALNEKLSRGKKLRIKYGIDPTSKHIHLGRAVALLKLQALQDLGHTIVFIVGDFTGVIGDTSDKESERPMLSRKEVKENMRTYVAQAKKILSSKNLEIHYNSKWLSKLRYHEIGEQADAFSLSDFISRENIKKRLTKGERISLREVLYPIMQGHDSVAVRADVEIGGTDQKFNMLAGRRMQEKLGQQPQDIIMLNIIEGTDGRKMSSSWGNTINLLDKPDDMFGKVMRIPDSLIMSYFVHCTRISTSEVEKIQTELMGGNGNPRDIKLKLAKEIVTLYHGVKNGNETEENFIRTFSKQGTPENIKEIKVKKGTPLFQVAQEKKLVQSKTEWRRLVEEGAIEETTTGEKIKSHSVAVEHDGIFKIGKRRFLKIKATN